MKSKINENEYAYRVGLFCAGNMPHNTQHVQEAKKIARGIAERNYVLVNGASKDGLMGVTGEEAAKHGGDVYGVGLRDYEVEIPKWASEWEGYSSYEHRIRRLTDLSDVYIALAGGLGTIHEIMTIHINHLLGTEKRPVILLGETAKNYRTLCQQIKIQGLYWDTLPEYMYFAETAEEALNILDTVINIYDRTDYVNPVFYPAMSAREIYDDIKKCGESHDVLCHNIKLTILPDVYPPNRFRSTKAFGKLVNKLDLKDKVVFDIGCGPGNLGILGAINGAKEVTGVDINPQAVKNAKLNVKNLKLTNVEIKEGSVFGPIKDKKADVIFFNPPFHNTTVDTGDSKLMHCVSTDKFTVLDTFFSELTTHLKPNGKVYLGFSNKDESSLEKLESLMGNFDCKIVNHKFANTSADNRLYEIKLKSTTPVAK